MRRLVARRFEERVSAWTSSIEDLPPRATSGTALLRAVVIIVIIVIIVLVPAITTARSCLYAAGDELLELTTVEPDAATAFAAIYRDAVSIELGEWQ